MLPALGLITGQIMVKRVKLRIPLHITGLWVPVWRRSPLLSGSIGAGLLLEPHVVAEATSSSEWGIEILVEGRRLDRVPSIALETLRLVEDARPAHIVISSPVPLGAGFAVSAAIALGIALGTGFLNGWGLVESASLAHIAEVRAGTGLGDVVAMLYGQGLEARLSPGGPGIALVESYAVPRRDVVVAVLGSMETREMHRVLGERLYSAAPRFARFLSRPSLASFLREARGFSIETGMVDEKLAGVLDGLVYENLLEGWYVKKRVAVLVPVPSKSGLLERRVNELGLRAYRLRIASAPLEISAF